METISREFSLSKLRQGVVYDDEAPFQVAARVAMQLGRESISNSITAIIELVKNAYDADAENVSINFYGFSTATPFMIIEDDGNGMTLQQLRKAWLLIGTDNKKQGESRSINKRRVFTGEKGLGRLGIDRLCKETILQTFSEDDAIGAELYIDWSKYETGSQQPIDEIKHGLRELPSHEIDPLTKRPVGMSHGTRVILYNLKDDWTEAYLKKLRTELLLLISPFSGINDFTIRIDSGRNWDSVDGVVTSGHLLDTAEWKMISTLSAEGIVSHELTSDLLQAQYSFPPTRWKKVFPSDSKDYPACGAVRFELYFYRRRKVNLSELTISKAQIEEFLNSNQGIRIYRDNFRVKPYGSPDGTGDWLTLSYRRQASPQGVAQEPLGGWRVGYNQVIGAVFISRDHNGSLIDQTNRESIVEGEAFSDLKRYALHAIQFFEKRRQEFELARREDDDFEKAREDASKSAQASTSASKRLRDAAEKLQSGLNERGEIDGRALEELLLASSKAEEAAARAEADQKRLAAVAETQQAKLAKQKDTLGNLASLGILATAFGHETLGSAYVVHSTSEELRTNLQSGLFMVTPNVRAAVDEDLDMLIYESDKIERFAKFTLRNVQRDKRERNAVYIHEIILSVFHFFDTSLREKNIDYNLDGVESVRAILAFRIDWESIIVNLITNAVWAMEDKPDSERQIEVRLWEEDNTILLAFEDSGIGIPAGQHEDIFLATVSTKTNEDGELIGTGMGLFIVKDFVESHPGGEIFVTSPSRLGGAQFTIKVDVPKISNRGIKKHND